MAQNQPKPPAHIADVIGNIFGWKLITVPNRFHVPSEYQTLGLNAVLKAWDIKVQTNDDGTHKFFLPRDWSIVEMGLIKWVRDANDRHRLSVHERTTILHTPVVTQVSGDYESTEWIEVLHHGEEMFHSTVFDSSVGSENIIDLEDDGLERRNISDEEVERMRYAQYLRMKPYWDEAEAYVQKYYPLLDKDPNAYW